MEGKNIIIRQTDRQTDRAIILSFCDAVFYSWQEYVPDG